MFANSSVCQISKNTDVYQYDQSLTGKQTRMMLHCCGSTKCLKLHLFKDLNEPNTQRGGEFTASFVRSILMAES